MDKISEIAERIVCGGESKNLSRMDKNAAKSMGEAAAKEAHGTLLNSARFLSGQGKGRGQLGEVDDYMDVMLDAAISDLIKLKKRY